MARLIDAEPLEVLEAKTPHVFMNPVWANGFNSAIDAVKNAPTVDAEPVRHGIWIEDCGLVQCSACYEEYRVRTNYCPNCGAKMDKEENDG